LFSVYCSPVPCLSPWHVPCPTGSVQVITPSSLYVPRSNAIVWLLRKRLKIKYKKNPSSIVYIQVLCHHRRNLEAFHRVHLLVWRGTHFKQRCNSVSRMCLQDAAVKCGHVGHVWWPQYWPYLYRKSVLDVTSDYFVWNVMQACVLLLVLVTSLQSY
jgi:hypothetical protein